MSLGGTLLNCYLSNFRLALVAVLACVTIGSSAVQLQATVIPPIGLAPGSQYQLIFVTAGKRDATSSEIADYNAFVTAEAALNPSLPTAIWHVVGSTSTTAATDNAPSSGLPVYNTQGMLVSAAGQNLYDWSPYLSAPVKYDQFGISSVTNFTVSPNPLLEILIDTIPIPPHNEITRVWTGGIWGGNRANILGSRIEGRSYWGVAETIMNPVWVTMETFPGAFPLDYTTSLPFYALSEPITVPVPEPTSMAMQGLALVAVSWIAMRRRLTANG